MRTRHIDEWVTALLEDDLPADRRRDVLAHLDICATCTARVESVRAMTAELRALPAPPVPSDLVANVRARLTPRPVRRPSFWGWPALASGGATALAGLALVLMQLAPRAPMAPIATGGQDGTPAMRQDTAQASTPTPSTPANVGPTRRVDTPPHTPVRVATRPPTPSSPPTTRVPAIAGGLRAFATVDEPGTPTGYASGDGAQPEGISPLRPVRIVDLPPMPLNDAAGAERRTNTTAAGPRTPYSRGGADPGGEAMIYGAPANPEWTPPTPASPTPVLGMAGSEGFAPTAAVAFHGEDDSAPPRDRPLTYRYQNNATQDKDAYGKAEICNGNGCVQQLRGGTLEAQANVMPADGKPNVLLRVSTRAPGTLTVRYADAPAMAVQTVALSGVADEDVVLRLPQGSRGATLKLTLSSGMQAEELYLILPNEAERKPTSTVALNGEAPAKALAQLANEGGVVVLCPAAFAEQPIYANVSDTTAVNALSTLAARREFQADVCDTVVNIAPNCPAPR